MGLKINVGKSKVLTINIYRDQIGSCEMVRVNGEEMKEVDKFN